MTKSFMMMLTVFVVLGVSFGGTFIGGVALGKSQGNDSSADSSPLRPAAGLQQQGSDQSGQGFQRANASPEELARLREQFQSGELGRMTWLRSGSGSNRARSRRMTCPRSGSGSARVSEAGGR